MKQSRLDMKIKKMLAIIGLILSLLVIYYFVLPTYRVYQELSVPSIETWPTYTDSRLGLSFRYPPNWEVKQGAKFDSDSTDEYRLSIYPKNLPLNMIFIESASDKPFRDIQIDRLIKDYNGKNITINGLNFVQIKDAPLPNDYYFYLEGKAPIKFQLFNIYPLETFGFIFTEKMDKTLHDIIHSIKAAQ